MESFAEFIPYAGLVDEGIIITKDGGFLRTYRLYLRDYAFQSEYELEYAISQINQAQRAFTEDYTLYINIRRVRQKYINDNPIKYSNKAAVTFDSKREPAIESSLVNEVYITVFKMHQAGGKRKNYLFDTGEEQGLDGALLTFKRFTEEFATTIRAAYREVVPLNSSELLRYLHATISDDQPVKVPEMPFYLDLYLADKRARFGSVTLLDDTFVQTITIHEYPNETRDLMLLYLMDLPYEYSYMVRFTFKEKEKAKSELKSKRKEHNKKKKGGSSLVSEAITKEASELLDTEALSLTQDASAALSTLSAQDVQWGYLSTTVVVKDDDYEKGRETVKAIKEVFTNHGCIVKEESLGNPLAYLGTIPGNIKYNKVKHFVYTRNLIHFFPISDTWRGQVTNNYMGEITGNYHPLMVCKSNSSLFYLNNHVDDVAHELVIGPTGAGKSVYLCVTCLQSYRYNGAQVFFFDKGRTSYYSCVNAGGKFYDIGSDKNACLLNPLYEVKDVKNIPWLTNYFKMYFETKGITMLSKDENEIFEALKSLSNLPESNWDFAHFSDIIGNKEMREALRPFTKGEYKDLFKSGNDEISDAAWISFELEELMKRGEDIVRFILLYLLRKIEKRFNKSIPTKLVIDEGFFFLGHPIMLKQINDWVRGLRKFSVGVTLATQEMSEIRSTIFTTLATNCLTKILLPNAEADKPEIKDGYIALGCNEKDIKEIMRLRRKKDYFYMSPLGKQRFRLMLDDEQLKVITELL